MNKQSPIFLFHKLCSIHCAILIIGLPYCLCMIVGLSDSSTTKTEVRIWKETLKIMKLTTKINFDTGAWKRLQGPNISAGINLYLILLKVITIKPKLLMLVFYLLVTISNIDVVNIIV